MTGAQTLGTGSEQAGAYPRFSNAEMSRRRNCVQAIMSEQDLSAVVVYGRRGATSVPWLTGWHVTTEAAAIVSRDQPVLLLVQLYNHVPNARILAPDCDVDWAGPDTFDRVSEELRDRSPAGTRVGWIGDLPNRAVQALGTWREADQVVDVTHSYERHRMIKSEEELAWMRRGAELTDRSFAALLGAARPGASEWELASAVEASYVGLGGTNHLHFFTSTPMGDPDRCVPAQWPSRRRLGVGDAVVTELSTSYWGYPGQLLRTLAVADEPTGLYRELHAVAEAAFACVADEVRAGVHVDELVTAADVIADAGYSIYDDLLHGFGGGYLPPVLRTRQTSHEPVPDLRLQTGMTVVLQPNVITNDGRAGVQTGELLLVTDGGYERLHAAPTGLLIAPSP